jgi:hypothetical protein
MAQETTGGTSGRTTIVAITADDDRYRACRQTAMELATKDGSKLLLYDWDAATVLGAPLPTLWSGDQAESAPPSELDNAALEAAGRAEIGRQVGEAHDRGIESAAWLPSTPGLDALADYARDRRADVVVVPRDLHASGWMERIAEGDAKPLKAMNRAAPIRVVVVVVDPSQADPTRND